MKNRNGLKRLTTACIAIIAIVCTSTASAINVTNGMEAGWVFGQNDFTTGYVDNDPNLGATNPPTASTLNIPSNAIRDTAGGRAFLVDNGNNRVLIWIGLAPGADFNSIPPTAALGQQSFTSNAANVDCFGTPGIVSACGVDNPGGMWLDTTNNQLWLTDTNNNRTIGWDLAGIATGDPANYVIGQGGFTTNTANRDCADTGSTGAVPNACGLNYPTGVTGGNGRIIIADNNNYRVMFYPQSIIGLGSNKAAVGVLGEATFTSRTRTVTQSDLGLVCDVLWDSVRSRLSVADCDIAANRVMVWEGFDPASFLNGASASKVLGQTSFTTGSASAGASGLNGPGTLASCPSLNLFLVCDTYNNRVVVYDDTTLSNGEDALNVLGQPDFASTSPATSRTGLNFPLGVACDDAAGHFYVTDALNHRMLVYGDHIGDDPLVVNGGTATTNGNTVNITSTNGDLFSVDFPPGTAPLPPNTSVIITIGGTNNHPSIEISAMLTGPKDVTVPWTGDDICINDVPGATITTQGSCTEQPKVRVRKQDIDTVGECFVWEESDTVCRTSLTTLTITGLEHSAVYPVLDDDQDGVDNDEDACPNTDLNGPVPTEYLKKPENLGDNEVTPDGCNATQVLACKSGDTVGETKFGVTTGQLDFFTDKRGWAKDLNTDGVRDCFQ